MTMGRVSLGLGLAFIKSTKAPRGMVFRVLHLLQKAFRRTCSSVFLPLLLFLPFPLRISCRSLVL